MIARVCRWTAILFAIVAIVDPTVTLPRRERPGLRLLDATASDDRAAALRGRLAAAGFPIVADGEAATILSGGAGPTFRPATPLYAVSRRRPDVAVDGATTPPVRVAGQAVAVTVAVEGHGVRGQTTILRLQDAGVAVASATHTWKQEDEQWTAALSYLPVSSGAVSLHVQADAVQGEHDTRNNAADVFAPPQRGPIRTLVIADAVTWPAVFVRRALGDHPAFDVVSAQRTTARIATQAGGPPAALTRTELAPYEVLLVSAVRPDAADAVRWFVEERGGVVVIVPDALPETSLADLTGAVTFEPNVLESPIALQPQPDGLLAAELAIPRALPAMATVLASGPGGGPVVFAWRRGMGAVLLSGALDAWRYRDRDDGAFARFWTRAILQQAVTVPARLEVRAEPAAARPGDTVRVIARLRGTELPAVADPLVLAPARAHAVDPSTRRETAVRLWPSTEPGRYEGAWRADAGGDYAIDVAIGAVTAAAVVHVGDDVAPPQDSEGRTTLVAKASGGGVFADDDALLRALDDRFPPRSMPRPLRPARSVWWAAAFAVLLSAEWGLRRCQGLA